MWTKQTNKKQSDEPNLRSEWVFNLWKGCQHCKYSYFTSLKQPECHTSNNWWEAAPEVEIQHRKLNIYECRHKRQSNGGRRRTVSAIRTEHWGRLPASLAHPSHTPGLPGSSGGCPAPRCWWYKDQTAPRRDVWYRPRTSLGKMQAEVRHINT